MLTLSEIIKRLSKSEKPNFWAVIALGGLGLLVPPFAFGYLLLYARSLRKVGPAQLPNKPHAGVLLREGLPTFALAIATLYIPIWLGMLLGWPLSVVELGWLPVWLMQLVGSMAFATYLYMYLTHPKLEVLLNYPAAIKMANITLGQTWKSAAAFTLINQICWWLVSNVPLGPAGTLLLLFAHFFSLTVLVAHSTLIYRVLEKKGPAAFEE